MSETVASCPPSGDFCPVQSSLAVQDEGLLLTLHFRVLFSPLTTEAGSAVSVTAGAFFPVVPPMPTAIPPPGNEAEFFSVPVSCTVLIVKPCFLLNSALLL